MPKTAKVIFNISLENLILLTALLFVLDVKYTIMIKLRPITNIILDLVIIEISLINANKGFGKFILKGKDLPHSDGFLLL